MEVLAVLAVVDEEGHVLSQHLSNPASECQFGSSLKCRPKDIWPGYHGHQLSVVHGPGPFNWPAL